MALERGEDMMDDLTRRAFAAYYRTEGDANAVVDQPADTSGVVEHEGKTYVVLHNARGTLAVYRVRNSASVCQAAAGWGRCWSARMRR
jgi:hypothetical protein